jgi:hypothetical protein
MDENGVAPDPNATQQADPVSETAATPETTAAPEETPAAPTPEQEFATYTQEQLADHSERLNALESDLAGFKEKLHDAGIRLVT